MANRITRRDAIKQALNDKVDNKIIKIVISYALNPSYLSTKNIYDNIYDKISDVLSLMRYKSRGPFCDLKIIQDIYLYVSHRQIYYPIFDHLYSMVNFSSPFIFISKFHIIILRKIPELLDIQDQKKAEESKVQYLAEVHTFVIDFFGFLHTIKVDNLLNGTIKMTFFGIAKSLLLNNYLDISNFY